MTLHFKVPTIACEGCADSIAKAIETADSNARVSIDVESKIVNVDTQLSADSVKQVIQSIDHTVES